MITMVMHITERMNTTTPTDVPTATATTLLPSGSVGVVMGSVGPGGGGGVGGGVGPKRSGWGSKMSIKQKYMLKQYLASS